MYCEFSNRSTDYPDFRIQVVRTSSEYLFEHVNDEQSKHWCNVVTHQMSVRALGYFLIGHVQHHVGVVRERYLEIAD